jgi:hypothetical protein
MAKLGGCANNKTKELHTAIAQITTVLKIYTSINFVTKKR